MFSEVKNRFGMQATTLFPNVSLFQNIISNSVAYLYHLPSLPNSSRPL